jgi:hypothetical protein
MQFTDHDLRAAVAAGALASDRLDPLLDFLSRRHADAPAAATAPQLDLAHLLWYAGALIVMGAMGLFSTLAFSAMGGWALTATAVVYALAFGAAGHHLWHKRNLHIPGGLLIAIAVSMAPLAVYGRRRSPPGLRTICPRQWRACGPRMRVERARRVARKHGSA